MSDKPTVLERLATLEATQVESKKALDRLQETSDKLVLELTRTKGFIGGILFLGSCFFAFFKLTLPFLFGTK